MQVQKGRKGKSATAGQAQVPSLWTAEENTFWASVTVTAELVLAGVAGRHRQSPENYSATCSPQCSTYPCPIPPPQREPAEHTGTLSTHTTSLIAKKASLFSAPQSTGEFYQLLTFNNQAELAKLSICCGQQERALACWKSPKCKVPPYRTAPDKTNSYSFWTSVHGNCCYKKVAHAVWRHKCGAGFKFPTSTSAGMVTTWQLKRWRRITHTTAQKWITGRPGT